MVTERYLFRQDHCLQSLFHVKEVEDVMLRQDSVNVDMFKPWASRGLLRSIQRVSHIMQLQSFDSILRVANADFYGIRSCRFRAFKRDVAPQNLLILDIDTPGLGDACQGADNDY